MEIVLSFFAGIFLEMALFHLFNTEESKKHVIIAKSQAPYITTAAWGVLFLAFSLTCFIFGQVDLSFNPRSVVAFLGFSIWAVFLGLLSHRKGRKNK